MAIASSDLKFYLSGGAANSDPNASLGGVISSVEITSASLHNLFDRVSGAESASGDVEYRGFYFKNTHGTLTLSDVFAWFVSNTPSSDTDLAIALAAEGVNAQMETLANESTAPATVSFSAPSSKGTGLSMGNIAAGQYYGIWARRTVGAAAAAYSDDNAVIRVEGDSPA